MKAFADLLDNLVHTPQRNGKIRLLLDYFDTVSNQIEVGLWRF